MAGKPKAAASGAAARKVIKPAIDRLKVGKKRTKRYPDGSRRTADGKYAGRDGTNRSGAQSEARAVQQLRDDGFRVDGRQQTTRTPEEIRGTWQRSFTTKDGRVVKKGDEYVVPQGTIRRYDGAVEMNGQWKGIETKSGTASRTPEQRAIDTWLNQPENTLTTSDGRILHGVHDMRM